MKNPLYTPKEATKERFSWFMDKLKNIKKTLWQKLSNIGVWSKKENDAEVSKSLPPKLEMSETKSSPLIPTSVFPHKIAIEPKEKVQVAIPISTPITQEVLESPKRLHISPLGEVVIQKVEKNKIELKDLKKLWIANIYFYLYKDSKCKALLERNRTWVFENLTAKTAYYVRASGNVWNEREKKFKLQITKKTHITTLQDPEAEKMTQYGVTVWSPEVGVITANTVQIINHIRWIENVKETILSMYKEFLWDSVEFEKKARTLTESDTFDDVRNVLYHLYCDFKCTQLVERNPTWIFENLSPNTVYYAKTSAEVWNKKTQKFKVVISPKQKFSTPIKREQPSFTPDTRPAPSQELYVQVKSPNILTKTSTSITVKNNITYIKTNLPDILAELSWETGTLDGETDSSSKEDKENKVMYHLYSDKLWKNLVSRNTTGIFQELSPNTTYFVTSTAEMRDRETKKYEIMKSRKVTVKTEMKEW